jgi:hypothetical protein
MTISAELEAKILRYHHVEKWRVGTIARQLNVHHSVVTRVLTHAGISKKAGIKQASIVAPFMGFITDTLEKYPSLTASRLYEMVRQRGYGGGPDHFRYVISLYRPRPPAEAYLRLRTYRNWTRTKTLDGVCHGFELFAKNIFAILFGRTHGKLFTWTHCRL